LWDLDTISEALGVSLPRRDAAARQPRPDLRGTWRIALFCELAGIPSPRFHVEVLRSLVEAGQARNISVAIHAVQPAAAGFHASLQRMIRLERPEGVIWFRITPDASSLEILNGIPHLRPRVPAVVVHGSMQDYPPPVLGHVFPDQSGLAEAVERWARKLRPDDAASHEVAVVAMRREGGGVTSIRNQRIDLIDAGIRAAGRPPCHLEVPDYSAGNADGVLRQCPRALGYICLSDEVAVGVKCLLTAEGRSAADNVIGFDQSPLAARCGIPSFNQSLEKIGEATWSLFLDFFRREDNAFWPPFRPVPVLLVLG
jgi:DNA-binding LacI/PurR family transcriptional regulator